MVTDRPQAQAQAQGIQAALAGLTAAITAPGTLYEIVDEDVRSRQLPVFRRRLTSLRALLERSASFGDRHFLIDGETRLDFRTHLEHVDAVAAWLQGERGVKAGERVALFAANRWEWVVSFWAIASIGAIPAAYNGWWTAEEYAHATDLVQPVLVLGDGPRLERVPDADRSVVDLDDVAGIASSHAGRRPRLPDVHEDDPAVLIFTSGTTGRPKAVSAPHRALIGFIQVNTVREAFGVVAMGGAVPTPADPPVLSDENVLVTSPLFHTSMLYGVVLMAMAKGSGFVLLPGRFDPQRVLETIERERVTMWLALGSAAPRVSASPGIGRYDTSSIRYVGVGGAPVSPAVQQGLREAFPSAAQSLGMGYTSTEAGAVIAGIGGPEFAAHPTSTGRLTPTTAVELRGPGGKPVAEGEEGEVHVRSPYLMLGYWNDPSATARAIDADGWLAMGDIARLEDGLLYINSRARDMILVSAENVSPTEIEYCLEAHPAVREAAVFAVDDPVTGDAVCAVVNVDPDVTTRASDLADWCRQSLAGYKVPTHWHLNDAALPRTASGKLLKNTLREQVKALG